MFRSKKYNLFKKILCMTMAVLFSFSAFSPAITAYAQTLPLNTLNLPPVGSMVPMSPVFTPALIKGVTVHPENPLKFNFIVDTGDSDLSETALKKEATRLIKYFLATITVPEDEVWVNLSPEEKDRIIPESFGVTEMGRDLLAQDYVLKQLTASLLYPEKELGETFWKRVRSIAKKKYGTDDIPMNSINKVWIVPEKAVVYEYQGSAYVVDSHLKIMMEEDYLASSEQERVDGEGLSTASSTLASKMIKEIIVPEIEKEVNQGENFARLRQVYNSMILASWYKDALKESLLVKVYANQKMIKGVDVQDKQVKQKIYDQYMEAFKEGVYNYIREDFDETTGEIVLRKYVSGGAAMKIEPIKQVIKGAPDQLTAEDFSMVTKGLDLNSKKSRLMNFDVTVVENLTDAQSKKLVKSLKNATAVSTKLVDSQNPEDEAMTVAPYKEVANHIQSMMTLANQQSREFNAEQREEIGFTNEMVTAINQDASIAQFITLSEGGTAIVEQIPEPINIAKAQAETNKTQFKESLAALKALIEELSQITNDGDYLKTYENFDPLYNRIKKAIFDLRTNFKTDILLSSKEDKITRIQTLVNNTLKHYLANKLIMYDIAPDALENNSSLKRTLAFKVTRASLTVMEAVFEILTNLKDVPELMPNAAIFNLDAEIAQRSTTVTEKVSRSIIETMETLHLNDFEIDPDDTKTLNLNNDRIASINKDVSIPLWIKGQEGETLKVKYLTDMPKLLRETAEDKLIMFIGIFSLLKNQFKDLVAAKTEGDYEFAFAGVEESVQTISKYLNGPRLFVRSEDVITISSASTKVKYAQQMISNTIRHFINNKISPIIITDPLLTPFEDMARRIQNLRTAQRSIDAVDAIINILLHLQEVPKAQGDDGVFDIEGMIKERVPEDYAMTSATKIASAIFDLAESGHDTVTLSPQQIAELGITPETITEINQNLSLGLWLSGSIKDGITANTKLFISPDFKIIARENLDQISAQYFALFRELKTMAETHSQGEYQKAYERIATLINIINARLADMETSLKDLPATTSMQKKMDRIYTVFKNSIKYYSENRLHPEFINPENLPFNSTRAEKKAAIAEFNLGLMSLGVVFHKILNISSIPAFIDSLEIFDLQQTLGLNSRKPNDFAMATKSLELSYAKGIQDEFIRPTVIQTPEGKPKGRIQKGDSLVFFNFRSDRAREILRAFKEPGFKEFTVKPLGLDVVTMADYEIYDTIPVKDVAFPTPPLEMTVGETVSKAGFKQFRTAETEKYNHVTYFFNGKRDEAFENETRKLVDSPKDVSTYDEKPEMSAYEVTDGLIERIQTIGDDMIIVNYANPDMVGHTGNFEAAQKAIEAVDANLKRAVKAAKEAGYNIIITADHGNAEQMWDHATNEKFTAHTTNPVPFIFIPSNTVKRSGDLFIRGDGKLADVSPTILQTLKVKQPAEMTGQSLVGGLDYQNAPQQKTILIILDGWGVNPNREDRYDAIRTANTPYMDFLMETSLHTQIKASGRAVGLPKGLMGNSDVGHSNLGGGRVDNQLIVAIDLAIENKEFFKNPRLVELMEKTKSSGQALHLMGLVSDGRVHSAMNHLFALIQMAKDYGIEKIYIHPILDGRDTSPESGVEWIKQLENKIEEIGAGEIVDIIGRYYAMDRDKRWDRVQIAYDMYTDGKTEMPQDDNAMISYELKQLALMQKVFDFNYTIFLAYDNPRLDELKSALQSAQTRLDLVEFYKLLKRIRLFAKLTFPKNLMAPYLTYKIRHILDFAEENRIRLPDGLNSSKDDVAMLTQTQINEANRRGIFNFEYPDTLEEKTGFLNRYLESDFFNAHMQYNLITYYRALILLRDQVGKTLVGQPYSYLTQKINAVVDFAHDTDITLPTEQSILPQAEQQDMAIVPQKIIEKADAQGLFDFTYPRISGAEKDSAIKIKAKVFHAQAKKDLIGYYAYIVALRKAVGSRKYKGRPYNYLTKKIKAIETFASVNAVALPAKTDIQVADYAMVADIEKAATLLDVDSSVIYLALMLGYNELPHDLSQYYGVLLDTEEIQTLDLKEVDADIFIKAIAGESERPVSEENIVDLLETAGLFATLTDQWRDQQIELKEKIQTGDTDSWGVPAYQNSPPIKHLPSGGFIILSEDEAMTVKEEAPKVALALGIDKKNVELALGLAAYGLPYELTLEMGMPALEILTNKAMKKVDPYLFINNLIEAANLNLSFSEIVKRLEAENIFTVLTQKIRADEIENQQIISLDIPSAAQTLKMDQNKIELALKLATIGISYSAYLDHSVILEDVNFAGMRVIFAEPSIFIDALIEEGNLPINAEGVVESLEKAGIFLRLTEEWRAEQASFKQAMQDESVDSWGIPLFNTEDEAMTVKAYVPPIAKALNVEEAQVKMALGLAAFNIPYELALTYGNVPLDKFDSLPIEKIHPYVFMENLIEIAHLKLTAADIIDRLEKANVFPSMTETYRKDEKENKKMIAVDVPLAVNALAIDQKAIELALKLASIGMPYSMYLEYGPEINEDLSAMYLVLGDPFIFIETLLGISNMERDTEGLVELLEQNNLFTRLTEAWRKAQNSLQQSLEQGKVDSHGIPFSDNYAMSVESNVRTLAESLEIDEETVELAVLLAYKGIPYGVYVDHGPVIEDTIEDVDLEEADPDIFLETLITEADLDMNEEALIALLEEEGLFYEITENFLAHQQAVEDALNAGLPDSWGAPLLNAEDEATSDEDIEEGPGYYVGGWTYANVLNHIYPELLALADSRQTTPITLLTQLRDDFESGEITEDDQSDETFKILKFNLHGTGEWDAEDIEAILNITKSVVANLKKQNSQAKEDNAMASSPQRIAFDIERSLARLQNLHLDKKRIETQKPLNGIIELQVAGQTQYNTPEGWSGHFQMKIEDEEQILTILKEKQKEQEQNSPTNADGDIPAIINAFEKGLFEGQEESLLDLNLEYNLDLSQYTYFDNPSSAYAELKSLGHLAPLTKMNLFIFGEKSRFSFVELWNVLSVYHNISLHVLTYADGTKNIIVHFNFLDQKQEDTAMTTSSTMVSYQVEKTLQALEELTATRKRVMGTKTEDGLILLNVGQVLLKTPEAWGDFFQRLIKEKQADLFRLLKKEKKLEEIAPTQADSEMDTIKSLFAQKYFSKRMEEAFSDTQKKHEFVKGDTNVIYNRLLELSRKLYVAKTNLFVQGERQKITFFDALNRRYKFETLHIIEYADGSINAILVSKEKETNDSAMTTSPSFLNFKVEQTFEQLKELVIERSKMMMLKDQGEIIVRNFGQTLAKTPEAWVKFYQERIDSEKKTHQDLVTKRDQQEKEEPTNADLEIQHMEALFDSGHTLDTPLSASELSPLVASDTVFKGKSEALLQLRELRHSLMLQKVNIFTNGFRNNFTETFSTLPFESNEVYLHVITYKDGSINALYAIGEPKGEEDTAMASTPEALIEKPRVLVVMDDPQKTNDLYLKLNQTGGLFVNSATNNTEALQLIARGIIPTIVLTDNQNLINALEKNYPKVSVFAYTEKGQRLRGNNILFKFSQNAVQGEKLGSEILQTLWRVNDSNSEYGGIDFTRSRLNLEIRRDGKGVPLPINDQPLENMNIEGFFPVIINVTPIQNLPLMIGLSEKTDLLARKK